MNTRTSVHLGSVAGTEGLGIVLRNLPRSALKFTRNAETRW
jgi:hypothetical protein